MYQHAIKLLRDKAPTLSHEGRRDAFAAVALLEQAAKLSDRFGGAEKGFRVSLDKP